MKVRSVKANFVYNSLRIFSTAVIGIIMMPYINKTLGVVNLGKIEYSNSIINYFLIFSGLGIPMYGIREISKVKKDILLKTKVVLELLAILFLTSILSYVILMGLLFVVPSLQNYHEIIIILSSTIFLTNIGAEWYFQGMEDQKFITIRFLVVRLITLGLLFALVKRKDDYLWYVLIIVLNVCGSNLFNIFYLVKQLNFNNISWADLDIKRHFKPILTIFIATISVNIYLQLDLILLGSFAGDKFVGLYAASNKLVRFVIIFVTVIGSVLLPRLSLLYVEDKEGYYNYLGVAFKLILLVSIPASILLFFFANEIIIYLAGDEFIDGILTVKILSPLCIVVGLAYYFGYLVFYVQNKEKIYSKAVVFSAISSVILNFFLIKIFYQNGAAFVAVFVEVCAIVFMIVNSKESLNKVKFFDTDFYKILVVNFIMALFLFIMLNFFIRDLWFISFVLGISVLLYINGLYFLKESTTRSFVDGLISKLT